MASFPATKLRRLKKKEKKWTNFWLWADTDIGWRGKHAQKWWKAKNHRPFWTVRDLLVVPRTFPLFFRPFPFFFRPSLASSDLSPSFFDPFSSIFRLFPHLDFRCFTNFETLIFFNDSFVNFVQEKMSKFEYLKTNPDVQLERPHAAPNRPDDFANQNCNQIGAKLSKFAIGLWRRRYGRRCALYGLGHSDGRLLTAKNSWTPRDQEWRRKTKASIRFGPQNQLENSDTRSK